MVKWMRGAALLGVLALAACDLVDPVPGVQDEIGVAEAKTTTEATAAGAAAAIKQATEFLIKAKSAVGSVPSAEAVQQLTRASEMISQAEAALKAGDPGRATSLALESAATSRKVLAGATSTGTSGAADKAAGAIREATDLLVKAKVVTGPTPSAEVLQLLSRASELIGKAEAALKAGDPAGATTMAAESAAISRKLLATPPPPDPSAKAAGAIKEATELLAKARAVAGPTPTTEISRALASADELLRKAGAALEARDFTAAAGAAGESAAISRKLLATPPPEPDVKTKAAGAIKEATTALSRARSAVGATPSAEAAQALRKAEELLHQAEAALAAGDPTNAVRLAGESQTYSRPLIPKA